MNIWMHNDLEWIRKIITDYDIHYSEINFDHMDENVIKKKEMSLANSY